MNCERFHEVIGDLSGEQSRVIVMETGAGITDPSERARALEHAVECDACALIWEEERSLSTGLRNLAVEMRSLTAPPQLEAKVLAAFRERDNIGRKSRTSSSASIRAFPPRQVSLPRYWLAAIAALLLIILGVVAVRSGILSRSKPEVAGNEGAKKMAPSYSGPPENKFIPAVPPKEVTSPPAVSNDNVNYYQASHPRRAGRARFGTATVISATLSNPINEGKSEIATDFFPIGYGATPNLQEGGQLLRVELPRAAVARFGLPVNMDRPSETVKADVLVGADGLAQAIRFVH